MFWLWGWAWGFLWLDQSSAAPRGFLFVVDTSFSMAPKKETLRNTAYDLVYSGIGGEMKQGDLFSFWTFNENIDTQQFAPTEWNPSQRQALANRAYAFLKDQPFQKISRFDKALGEILRATEEVSLTIVILSDGLEFMRRTPFDLELNTAYATRSAELRRIEKPFITVLQSTHGLVVGWSVAAVGEPVRIPPLPATARSDPAEPRTTTEQETNFVAAQVAFSERKAPLPTLAQADSGPAFVERSSVPSAPFGNVTNLDSIPLAGTLGSSGASLSDKLEKAPAATETNIAPIRGPDQEIASLALESSTPLPVRSPSVNPGATKGSTFPPVPALKSNPSAEAADKKIDSIKTDHVYEKTPLPAPNESVKAREAAPGNSKSSESAPSLALLSRRNDPVNVKASPGITEASEGIGEEPLIRGQTLLPQATVFVPVAGGHTRWAYFSIGLLSLLAGSGLIYFCLLKPLSTSRSSLISSSVSRNAHGKPPSAFPPIRTMKLSCTSQND